MVRLEGIGEIIGVTEIGKMTHIDHLVIGMIVTKIIIEGLEMEKDMMIIEEEIGIQMGRMIRIKMNGVIGIEMSVTLIKGTGIETETGTGRGNVTVEIVIRT